MLLLPSSDEELRLDGDALLDVKIDKKLLAELDGSLELRIADAVTDKDPGIDTVTDGLPDPEKRPDVLFPAPVTKGLLLTADGEV